MNCGRSAVIRIFTGSSATAAPPREDDAITLERIYHRLDALSIKQ
jgi:hypothetical protein